MHTLMRLRRTLGAALMIAACGLSVSQAQVTDEVSAADAGGVRAVIEAQLKAFAGDDAQRAFSFASDEIRSLFGSPERFLSMVRDGYPVVYRPASVSFMKPQWIDRTLIQRVQMSDAQGTLWIVIYEMQHQEDRSWRINGCVATRTQGRAT